MSVCAIDCCYLIKNPLLFNEQTTKKEEEYLRSSVTVAVFETIQGVLEADGGRMGIASCGWHDACEGRNLCINWEGWLALGSP